jgi:O-6-methylguanine DNA methyltransferase
MIVNGRDPIVDSLGRLSAQPPRSLVDKVVAHWARVDASTGELYVAFTDHGIRFVRPVEATADDGAFLTEFRNRFARPVRPATRLPTGLRSALRGRPSRDLQFDLRGLSDFERDVLAATRLIPAGQTRPYSWVAGEIGRPRAVRAVGSALGRNPVPLLIPCHRVTRSDGQTGEYVFGTGFKERLLRAENVNIEEVQTLAKDRVFFLGSDTTGIVCFPTCHHARRITTAHRRGFRSIAEAAGAGYRPCRSCRPSLQLSA